NRDSVVITDEDYIGFVQRMSDKDPKNPVPETVRFRLRRWPILFVGYSLRDYNLRLLIRTLRWRVDEANVPTAYAVDPFPDPLILRVWQDSRRFVTFFAENLWTFVPWLYREVTGQDFPADERPVAG
ncbi:MAG: SIR2 family protein, partial [Acidobacteriota bacterium]